MEKLSILTADLLDIIFEYRNKLYGAYELRKTYPKRITYALSATFLICLLFAAGTMLANSKKTTAHIDYVADVVLNNVVDEPKQDPPPQSPPKQEMPKIETMQFVPPKIVPDDQVKDDDLVPDVDNLEDVKISTITEDGVKYEGVVAPPVEKVAAIVSAPKVEGDDDVFRSVSIEARFPGDLAGWTKYLRSHLNSDLPSQNGAPAGQYTVIVSFVVNTEGIISEVRAENDPGYGTKQEAIRVIQKGPNWIPAIQNGRNVIYRQKQAITFQVIAE